MFVRRNVASAGIRSGKARQMPEMLESNSGRARVQTARPKTDASHNSELLG